MYRDKSTIGRCKLVSADLILLQRYISSSTYPTLVVRFSSRSFSSSFSPPFLRFPREPERIKNASSCAGVHSLINESRRRGR